MELFDKSYYRMTKRIMVFIGQWPLQKPYKRRIIRVLVGLLMFSIAMPEAVKLGTALIDLDTLCECIPPFGLHIVNFIKCTACAFGMDKMKKLMIKMKIDWGQYRSNDEGCRILKKYAERGNLLGTLYSYYMFIGGLSWLCIPLIPLTLDIVYPLNESRPHEFLFQAEYFVDRDEYFLPIYVHSFITTMMSMIIVAGCDSLFGLLVHYVCAKFAELCEELENAMISKDFMVTKDMDETYRYMVKCVKKHVEAIEICNLLESTYTVYFLLTLGLNVFLMSFTGVQTVMRLDDPNLAMRYGCFTIGQVIHAFFNCWHGQIIIDHSKDVNIAVYKSKWYGFSARSRTLIGLMMMRSDQPCQLTVGKLFTVSLETFTTIMKTTMSYFTMLRSFQG